MSDVLVAALLGILQGLTEFLPVSSTAHLVIAEKVFRLDASRFGLAFAVAVHLGTALAVLLYFARTWLSLAGGLFRGQWRLPLLLAVGTIPAVIAGLLLEDAVAGALRDVRVVAVALVLVSGVFWLAERAASHRRDVGSLDARTVLLLGVAQAVALVPGVSRSGITISAGLFAGLTRPEATRFSFLLATPVILGAGAKTLLDARQASGLFADPTVAVVGFACSFVSGLAAVAFLVRFVRAHSLNWFIPYRVALAALLVVLSVLGLA